MRSIRRHERAQDALRFREQPLELRIIEHVGE
jgi:hypothetical protein